MRKTGSMEPSNSKEKENLQVSDPEPYTNWKEIKAALLEAECKKAEGYQHLPHFVRIR